MRQLSLSRSLLFFLEEIEYSEAALSADPDAASLAVPFRDALEEWTALFNQERLGRRGVIRTEAVVNVRNERIDAATIGFGALARVTAPDVLNRCFNLAPGKFVRRNLRQQCEATKNTIVPEIAKLNADHPLKPFAPKLDTLAQNALTALDDRAQAMAHRQASANDVLEFKEGINALRTTTYAELLKMAVDHRLPKSWTESFFRKADDAEDPPEPEPSTPTTGPTP
jgi:hypothetical protein